MHCPRLPTSEQVYLPIAPVTLSPSLLESELFGHLKGTFTGAEQDRRGLFALADDRLRSSDAIFAGGGEKIAENIRVPLAIFMCPSAPGPRFVIVELGGVTSEGVAGDYFGPNSFSSSKYGVTSLSGNNRITALDDLPRHASVS